MDKPKKLKLPQAKTLDELRNHLLGGGLLVVHFHDGELRFYQSTDPKRVENIVNTQGFLNASGGALLYLADTAK